MNPLPNVTSTDINEWANRRKAQSVLPRLVRRLIFATTSSSVSVSMPSGESVQLPGWDGYVRADRKYRFVPAGLSHWEMGVSGEVAKKANADYAKRSAEPLEVNPAESTFVFVTARKWRERHEWAADKMHDKLWRDVRAYDADDLEAWLDLAPSVKYPFASELGKQVESLLDLEGYWNDWRQVTSPIVSKGLVLAGREEIVGKVTDWLRSIASSRLLRADTQEEAIVFLACVIANLSEEERDYFFSRCLIVSTPEAWRLVVPHTLPLVLVPTFPESDSAAAVRYGHQVLVPGGRELAGRGGVLELPRLSSQVAVDELRNMGFGDERAHVEARLARRSLQAFRRKHCQNVQVKRPAWSEPSDPRTILAAFLAGSWEDSKPGDQEILGNLGGKPYSEIKIELHRLAASSDPPIRSDGNSWYLVSNEDSWLLLRRHLNSDFIDRFEHSCLNTFLTPDPALDLSVDQRWMANVMGHEREHSALLRRGLADTLAFLGSRLQQSDASFGVEYARIVQIVRRLLSAANNDETGKLWASLTDLMPLLAESAPDEFLAAVHDGLQGEPPLLRTLFGVSQGGDPLFNSYPYTGLIWALETLAWSPDHFGLATQCLARLAEIDPGGPLANRPFDSLEDIFLIWNPQTSASLDQRLETLATLLGQVPTITWRLLLSLLPTVRSVSDPTSRPVWRDWRVETAPGICQKEWERTVKGIADQILNFAGEDIAKLTEALVACTRRTPELWALTVEKILGLNTEAIDDETLADACLHLRRKGLWVITTKGSLNREEQYRADCLSRLIEHLEPRDLLVRHAWLFCSAPPLPDIFDGKWDHERQIKTVFAAQDHAVMSIHEHRGIDQLLALGSKVENQAALGAAVSRLDLIGAPNEADFLRSQLDSPEECKMLLGIGYVREKFHEAGWKWAEALVSDKGHLWSATGYALFLLQLPPTLQTWTWAKQLGAGTEAEYWSRFRLLMLPSSELYLHAVNNLLEHGQARSAVIMLGIMQSDIGLRGNESLVVSALDSAITGQRHQAIDQSSFAHYTAELLDYLDGSEEVTKDIVARLEWAYSLLLDPQYRKSKRLHQLMAHDPVFFAEVVSLAYKPSTTNSGLTAVACDLIGGWKELPSLMEDGSYDSGALKQWVQTAQQELTKRGCRAIGDRLIGISLSHGSDADYDGLWPLSCVREILESTQLASHDLKLGFITGIHVKRGTIIKSSLEDGQQERALSAKYNTYAQQLRDRWPVTALILRQAAESFKHEARGEDQRANLRRDLGF